MERKFQRLGLFKPGNCDKLRLFKLQLEHYILFVDEYGVMKPKKTSQ